MSKSYVKFVIFNLNYFFYYWGFSLKFC